MTKKTIKLLLIALCGIGAALLLWFNVFGPALLETLVNQANEGKGEKTVRDESKMSEIKDDPKFEEALKIKAKQQHGEGRDENVEAERRKP